jgi:hypothetical protein
MAENHPHTELAEVESLLRSLSPSSGGLHRDRLIFRAGRASALGPGRWAWPAMSAVLAVATVVLSVLLLVRPAPPERVVVLPAAAVPMPGRTDEPDNSASAADAFITPPSALSVARERQRVEQQLLRWGLDALPAPAVARPEADTPHHVFGVPVEPSLPAGNSWLDLFSLGRKSP